MKHHYPLHFTLESGTHVEVNKIDDITYHFLLTTAKGQSDNFTYVEDNRSRDEIENSVDFDQLNALRAFWLKRDDLV